MQPEKEVPAGLGALDVLGLIVRHPARYVFRRWNYKSAVMSSLVRAKLFFSVNLTAGLDAAVAAMTVEFLFRFLTAGFYGALTQAFRRVHPERAATVAVMILLPVAGHSVEMIVHWTRGTPNLAASLSASVILTAASTAFNLFAMRRGLLIVGEGSRSLLHDLATMPAMLAAFLLSWRSRPFI